MNFYNIFFLILLLHPPGVIRHGIDKQLSLDLARLPAYECVGMMTQNFQIKGSCVLIHPRMALTAAHALIKLTEGEPLIVEYETLRVKVDSFLIHPWFASNKGADLAVLYLSEEIRTISVATLNTSRKEIGQIGTSVGYGNFSVANNPRDIIDAGRVKSAGQNKLDSIEGIRLPDHQVPFLYADFDSPDNPEMNKSGSTECLPFEYGLDGGDSGGGMFVQRRKKILLAGINALQKKNISDIMRTGTFYGSASEWVRISVFRKWIKRKIKKVQ
ncbi:MAG: trypsin-like serine protease [Saprospiraceae bacterium]